jgi:hypothetical protein
MAANPQPGRPWRSTRLVPMMSVRGGKVADDGSLEVTTYDAKDGACRGLQAKCRMVAIAR